ncbi:MAG: hypothetical protein AAFZ92_10570 [Pseudomonadota bacterium]
MAVSKPIQKTATSRPMPKTALSDSDYPRVYGSPLNTAKPNPYLHKSSITIIDNKYIHSILKNEGYEVPLDKVKNLHFFPSPMDAFNYGLYQFGLEDIFIVLMINKRQNNIYGYHVLDLTQKYSLEKDLRTRLKTKEMVL